MSGSQKDVKDRERRVLDIFERHLPGALGRGMTIDSRVQTELGLPSLTLASILFDLQDAFDIDLTSGDLRLSELQTVGDFAALVA